MPAVTDIDLERMFGTPVQAAADLHELRVWAHTRTSLQPNNASSTAREMCAALDPTWPRRALTCERVMVSDAPRGYGVRIDLAESTVDSLLATVDGRKHATTRRVSSKLHYTLWPAQSTSWGTWAMQTLDEAKLDAAEIRRHIMGGSSVAKAAPYVHPAVFMLDVRNGASPYCTAVGDAMGVDRVLWKFASIPFTEHTFWTAGLHGFHREWLDMFPDGQLALWLRSAVCNGWFTSHQLAHVIGVDTARSCTHGWM